MAQADRALGNDLGSVVFNTATLTTQIKNVRFGARVAVRDNAALKDGVDYPKEYRRGYFMSGTLSTETVDDLPLLSMAVGATPGDITGAFTFVSYTGGPSLSGNGILITAEADVAEDQTQAFEIAVQGAVTVA